MSAVERVSAPTRALAGAWPDAVRVAFEAVREPLPVQFVPVAQAAGCVLSQDLRALTDLPAFPTSAMDGYAVAGESGPWTLAGEVLAGARSEPLSEGCAIRITTGAELPVGATAVLRWEHAVVDGETVRRAAGHQLPPGRDIRGPGGEARRDDVLLAAGTRLGPAALGLAAAAGHDTLPVRRKPRVQALVLGDELLDAGPARDGCVRDALTPALPGWLGGLGCALLSSPRRLPDRLDALVAAIRHAVDDGADVVVTTGGTAASQADHVHAALAELGARLLVDGVAVRPGHPQLLAVLPGRPVYVLGLPGNPFAAVSGLVTLGRPLVAALCGEPVPAAVGLARLGSRVGGVDRDHRLVPVRVREGEAEPVRHRGASMLRGLVDADALAVVAPGSGAVGDVVELLPLP